MVAGLTGAFIVQVILLIAACRLNRDVLSHTDGIFYLRLASYYLNGNFDFAVSGYWGPLYSWLIAPLLAFVEKPLYAARIVMVLSAVVFLFGCISVLRNLEIHPVGVVAGAWIAALASVAWSVETNNPDLLMSGLLCLAIGKMVSLRWLANRRTQVTAGLFWAMAYLAKAIAFPLAFITSGVIAVFWGMGQKAKKRIILRSLGTTMLAFLSVAAVWILVLSLKYGGMVVSTSGRINHTIVGPPDKKRHHPHTTFFHVPEPGRITAAEDPSTEHYEFWSPFENPTYAKHQVGLIFSNLGTAIKRLMGFSYLSIGVLAAFYGLLASAASREVLTIERWRWAGAIVFCIVAMYLPVYAFDQRYYYPAYAFMLAASFGLVARLTPESQQGSKLNRRLGFGLVIFCFALPTLAGVKNAFTMPEHKLVSRHAYEVAKKLVAAKLQGSIAGGSTAGLYVAFCADQPWHGQEEPPSAIRFKASKAKLIIVYRRQLVVEELDHDASFRNLDSLLFDNAEQAGQCPLKVYQLTLSIPNE